MTDLTFTPLTDFLGVDVHGWRCEASPRSDIEALQQALAKHRLLRMRGLELTPSSFVAIAESFGPVRALKRANAEGAHFREFPQIKIVANGQSADGIKLGDGDAAENAWHTDGTYLHEPTTLTFLYGRKAPARPPRTLFLDLAQAYRQAPENLKSQILGRRAIHYSPYNHDEADADRMAQLADPAQRKQIGPWRPLVVRDPASGAPCLMPPRQADCVIDGFDEADSRTLAKRIWDFLLSPERSQGCIWGEAIMPGDLLFWDNRFTLHMREAFEGTQERLLWHTSTFGAPFEAFRHAA